jgi:hypothetical protein
VKRYPVDNTTCTVLGHKAAADSPLWTGLDLTRAELRVQSTLFLAIIGPNAAPLDLHLDVPWCHPEDQTGDLDDFDSWYRVRPIMEPGKKWKRNLVKSVAFERWDGKWWLAVE